jgi:hypothetical protein
MDRNEKENKKTTTKKKKRKGSDIYPSVGRRIDYSNDETKVSEVVEI